MLFWITLMAILVILLFGFVVVVGPPYLPTMKRQTDAALEMLNLQPGQTLLELGSGDGRVMLAALEKGYKVVGIELNPILVVVSIFVTWRFRKNVRIIWGSYWGAPWPRADAIFTFMLPKYMDKLDARVEKWRNKPIKLASFAFAIPGKEPIQKQDGVFLYEYK